ncbi:MAG TPA: DUF2271 domain-containing protein [Paludibacter sp.]|nr:DUF2271 domain-containing protein [Paludibacter sp.]
MKAKLLISFFLVCFLSMQAQTNGTLTVTTTTSSPGANTGYDPKNVLAIWVQDSAGKLVNTMLYNTSNGNSSAADLTVWYGLIGSWTNRAAKVNVDGITGATNSNYGTKTCYWGKTVNISTVPDGVYTVKMEILCDNVSVGTSGHKIVAYTFTKGAATSTGTISGTTQACFSNTSITWSPKITGLDDIMLGKLYSVYPNPTKSTIYVNGGDVNKIEIFTVSGKRLLTTNQQQLNLEQLPKGIYMAQISTSKGMFIKKVVKE